MSRPDLRLKNVPTMLNATLVGTGELIPRSGDYRVVVTDLSYKGQRPLFLRQYPENGNLTTGVAGDHFLMMPIEGSANFKTPLISQAGVAIYNATESAQIVGSANPEKVLVSANYYYFRQSASYFDNSLRFRCRLNASSASETKQSMLTKNMITTVSLELGGATKIFSIKGRGTVERTYYHGQDGVDLLQDSPEAHAYTVTVGNNSYQSRVSFGGNNLPVDKQETYPNSEPGVSIATVRYNMDPTPLAYSQSEQTYGFSLYKDDLQYGVQYSVGEIYMEITVLAEEAPT